MSSAMSAAVLDGRVRLRPPWGRDGHPRLPVHRIREILRQSWSLQRTQRDIAASVGCSVGMVWKVLDRASAAGLGFDDRELDDRKLEQRMLGKRVEPKRQHALPDFEAIHREHRRPGVTLELLHIEYLSEHPDDGYRYQQLCALYRRWLKRRKLTMRQIEIPRKSGSPNMLGREERDTVRWKRMNPAAT